MVRHFTTSLNSRFLLFWVLVVADSLFLMLNLVATHRYNVDEGDWGFTRFFELRKLFHTQWDGQGVPLVQNDEANITAYVRIVKDPTGVLWHSFQKYGLHHFASFMLLTGT
jgi:hypothetical protein